MRLIHGDCDQDVPLDIAFRLKDRLRSADVQVTIIKGGGHRLSEPHEIDAILRTVAVLVEPARMIFAIAAAIAAARRRPPPAPTSSPRRRSSAARSQASKAGNAEAAAQAFEQAAGAQTADEAEKARMLAAAGNMWIAANQPGKAALALDKALAGTGLQAEQRGEALLDRARAAEAQNDLKTARAKVTEAAQTISEDPFLWYFSAALAIREGDARHRQGGDRQGADAGAERPDHPVRGRPRRPFRRR